MSFLKISASKRRLSFNRMSRARVEFSDSSFAGRTAKSRVKLVNKLVDKKNRLSSFPTFSGTASSAMVISSKRKSAAKKLMLARKVRKISPSLSKALK